MIVRLRPCLWSSFCPTQYQKMTIPAKKPRSLGAIQMRVEAIARWYMALSYFLKRIANYQPRKIDPLRYSLGQRGIILKKVLLVVYCTVLLSLDVILVRPIEHTSRRKGQLHKWQEPFPGYAFHYEPQEYRLSGECLLPCSNCDYEICDR
jgi:hypothetical protein